MQIPIVGDELFHPECVTVRRTWKSYPTLFAITRTSLKSFTNRSTLRVYS